MGQRCTICTHPKRAEIDRAVVDRRPFRDIARQFKVTKDVLVQHHDNHLQAKLLEVRGITDALTQKQETFRLAYLETGNASEAYRTSYSTKRMSAKTINEEACKLLKHPKIAPRIEADRREARERCQVTIESVTEELEDARLAALALGQASAAVSASMGKAKLHGLIDAEPPPAPGLNLAVVLGNIDKDELMRRYAETIILRQQRRQRLGYGVMPAPYDESDDDQ